MEHPRDHGEDILPSKMKLSVMFATSLSIASGGCAIVYGIYFMSSLIIPTLVISNYLMIPGLVLILLGVLFPFFTVLGFRGIVKEDSFQIRGCYIAMYIFIAITLLLTIYVSVVTYSNIGEYRALPLQEALDSYHEDLYMAGRMNTIQKVFDCCGVMGYLDWNNNEAFTCDENNLDTRRCNVPASCCIRNKTQPLLLSCGAKILNDSIFQDNTREGIIHMKGCSKKIDYLLFTTTLDMLVVLFLLLTCEVVVLRLCSYFREILKIERENSPYFHRNEYAVEYAECSL